MDSSKSVHQFSKETDKWAWCFLQYIVSFPEHLPGLAGGLIPTSAYLVSGIEGGQDTRLSPRIKVLKELYSHHV